MVKSLSLKKTNLILPWLGGLVLVGIGTLATLNYWQTKSDRSSEIITQTILVKSEDLTVQIQANGIVQALRTNNLSPDEPGRIAELYITEGDRVEEGQVIALMDSDRVKAQVDRYKAAVQKAQANFDRIQAGNRSEVIAAAEARVTTAQANIAVAQARLKRTQEEKQRNQLLVEEGAISRNSFNEFVTKEAEAQANLEAELARLREQQENLREAQNGPLTEEITQAKAELAQAKAEFADIQIQLDKTEIRAPFTGIITRRYAEVGDFVDSTTAASDTEGATSTSIAELSSGLEIEAKIPEANISKIKLGQTVDIKVDAYINETFKGKVRLIAPRAVKENNVTSFRVKVDLTTGKDKLQSGMNTRLAFLSKPIAEAIAIPLAAVVTQPDGQTGVYIAEDSKAEFKPIQLGMTSGNLVQILEGLTPGDRVFISPPQDLKIKGVDTVNVD